MAIPKISKCWALPVAQAVGLGGGGPPFSSRNPSGAGGDTVGAWEQEAICRRLTAEVLPLGPDVFKNSELPAFRWMILHISAASNNQIS